MLKKISLLVFLSVPLMILPDDHGKKEGKSPKEMKRMEMMKKKEAHMKKEMERWGRWKPEDCKNCLLYTSPSPRDKRQSRMPSSA